MWKRFSLVASGAAVMALAFTACGGEEGDDTCVTDADCTGTNEICHPSADVCVRTCSSSADCPDEEKTCAAIGGGNTTMICQCATDALCAQGPLGAGAVCSAQHKVCVLDDTGNGTTTCNSSNQQPDACSYGQFCSGSSCTAVPAPSCSNFTGSGHGTQWSASSSTGPVIYEITLQDFAQNVTFCGASNPMRARFTMKAYRTSGTFSSTASTFEGDLHYVRTDGSEGPTSNTTQNITVSSDGRHVQWTQNLCAQSGVSSFTAGFHFVNGNEVCGTAQ